MRPRARGWHGRRDLVGPRFFAAAPAFSHGFAGCPSWQTVTPRATAGRAWMRSAHALRFFQRAVPMKAATVLPPGSFALLRIHSNHGYIAMSAIEYSSPTRYCLPSSALSSTSHTDSW